MEKDPAAWQKCESDPAVWALWPSAGTPKNGHSVILLLANRNRPHATRIGQAVPPRTSNWHIVTNTKRLQLPLSSCVLVIAREHAGDIPPVRPLRTLATSSVAQEILHLRARHNHAMRRSARSCSISLTNLHALAETPKFLQGPWTPNHLRKRNIASRPDLPALRIKLGEQTPTVSV
ncbi:hypothetical protein PSPO01_03973 [Paraphaeosphaeria sporulosa]